MNSCMPEHGHSTRKTLDVTVFVPSVRQATQLVAIILVELLENGLGNRKLHRISHLLTSSSAQKARRRLLALRSSSRGVGAFCRAASSLHSPENSASGHLQTVARAPSCQSLVFAAELRRRGTSLCLYHISWRSCTRLRTQQNHCK